MADHHTLLIKTPAITWHLQPPTDGRPGCPCNARPFAEIGCDHLWCPSHEVWANDTGFGPNCCPREAFVSLVAAVAA